MSSDVLDAKISNVCISELIGRLERFDDAERALYPWADRFVMGYPLPPWQRPLVWVGEQKILFIQSIWAGVDLGSYLVNDQYEFIKTPRGDDIYREFSDVLLDGQQRLSCIEEYLMNKFAVPDKGGTPRYWRDLPRIERRRFGGYHFARASIKSWNEPNMRLAYDLRAFGGTPHTDDQRATTNQPADLRAGDSDAAQAAVGRWNSTTKIGSTVLYLKSEIEGKCQIRTASAAYVFGGDAPAVDLDYIGMVLLDRVEPFFG